MLGIYRKRKKWNKIRDSYSIFILELLYCENVWSSGLPAVPWSLSLSLSLSLSSFPLFSSFPLPTFFFDFETLDQDLFLFWSECICRHTGVKVKSSEFRISH